MSGPISSIIGGGQPIGSIVQSPYNLSLVDSAWLPCDGRAVLRATYPRLSACLPSIGTFTATFRNKGATPVSSAIANNGALWVVTGATGTSNLYSTTDGITYTPRTTPASCDIRGLSYDGTNFVGVSANGSGVNPQYSSNGTAWSTSATAAQVSTGATSDCLTWASTLGTVGRFCMLTNGTAVFTSDDRGVTWTSRATGLAGTPFHICWTGQKYIASIGAASTIGTSSDGITWSPQTMPFATSAATAGNGMIASDGNGRVLMAMPGAGAVVAVSLDHGATWSQKQLPFGINNPQVSYENGRFIYGGGAAMSVDLIGWTTPDNFANGADCRWSYKSGVYLVTGSVTAAWTVTEDTTKIQLPTQLNAAPSSMSAFIKVQ